MQLSPDIFDLIFSYLPPTFFMPIAVFDLCDFSMCPLRSFTSFYRQWYHIIISKNKKKCSDSTLLVICIDFMCI